MSLLLQLKFFDFFVQSLATEDDLNDASKQKISEKMHRWDQVYLVDVRKQLGTCKLICNAKK